MQAQNSLARTQSEQATTFERLSTGLRVNSAKDDAGGLYLAQSQTKDIRGLSMATRNAGDGISMAQTAEGALDQIGQNLQRINELAIQSANGTYSEEARGGLQKEVDQLTQEINRIVETTEFNGQKLLSEDAVSETLQIGFQNDAGSRIQTGLQGGIEGQGALRSYTFNGASESFRLDDAVVDATNNTTDSQQVREAFYEANGIEVEGTNTKLTAARGGEFADAIQEFLGGGNNEELAAALHGQYGGSNTETIELRTADGQDFKFTFTTGAEAEDDLSDVRLEFTADNGNVVEVDVGAVDGGTTFAQFGGDGSNDDGLSDDSTAVGIATAAAPGAFETAAADQNIQVNAGNALKGILDGGLSSKETVNISTQNDAQLAISQTREAIDFVSELRADFGAQQNRFEAVISGNQTYSENLSAARSRIEDADFAVETANLAKQQVLQQAGISALGQANASGQAILGLL